ncbi:MAG: magnesium transporter CorA family protein [Acidobacteria bacterium]|nr:magnesium transporter CorA family protein [Acidobacteriota bacterium]
MHRDGRTEPVDRLDAAWLRPESGALVWADLLQPGPDEARVLREVFGLHELAVEDALETVHHPKIETYDGSLYIVLHGIDFRPEAHGFATHDIDFFLSPRLLVTVHDGRRRSIGHVFDLALRNPFVLAEGPVRLLHRIVDTLVDHYRPEIDALEERLDDLEQRVLERPNDTVTADILEAKRDITSLRRVVVPQRDIVGRLARREFDQIDQEMAYRFRDVHDQLVRMADDAIIFQDRVTGILDAHLASVSNRLGQVSKLVAVIATLFGPLTVITGLYGMNVQLPVLPGGEDAQFWWVLLLMASASTAMYGWFRRSGWL